MGFLRKIKLGKEREIRFLGFPILQYEKEEEVSKKTRYEIFPKSLEHKVCDMILGQIPAEHDLIIIARAGLGEVYILNFMLSDIISKYNAKKTCVVSNKEHYSSVFKMYSPDIPFYSLDIDNTLLNRSIINRVLKYNKKIFNINPCTFYEISNYFTSCETKQDNRHYIDMLKEFCNIKEFELKSCIFPDNIDASIMAKFSGLNFDNFVYVVTDANFIKPLDNHFWDELSLSLKNKGYDVVFNSVDISIPEARYLASKSKGIIALRCGFSEILSAINVQKHILYTECMFNNIPNLKDILTLSKYPNVDNTTLNEYVLQNDNQDVVLQDIIRKF